MSNLDRHMAEQPKMDKYVVRKTDGHVILVEVEVGAQLFNADHVKIHEHEYSDLHAQLKTGALDFDKVKTRLNRN